MTQVANGDVPRLAESLYRREAGRLVAMLTGIFGIDRLQMAEDAVQEALARALQVWPESGVPDNPVAWLVTTAKRFALDLLRRERRFQDRREEVVASIESRLEASAEEEGPVFEEEIRDRQLRLIFVCCHPALPLEMQTALALKTLCGLSPAEIARAYLTSEAAILKRLTRARQRVRERGIPFEIPSGEELAPRLDAVLQVLYLLFSEGYKASSGDSLVRDGLCQEAIRLTSHLAEHPAGDRPRTRALLALMLLNAARLPARMDEDGNVLRLEEQDRRKWDVSMIAAGLEHLVKAAEGGELSGYHLQAGIAACHCVAPDYASTDWKTILAHYDQWIRMSESPVVALNRAVAVANVHGPEEGLRAVAEIPDRERLAEYYLTHAVLGEFESRMGRHDIAAKHYREALNLAAVKSERAFLEKRLRECLCQAKGKEDL